MTTSIDSSHRHVHKAIPVDDHNSEDSLSDSSIDSMTADLDQIGKLNLPNITSITSWGESLIQMPNFEFSRIQDFSKEFSKYVFNYASSYRRDAGESSQGKEEDDETMLDSIKTVLSTRIQMNKFLNDLKLGVNITTAIDRLQPLTDMIHETIFLPAEDESEYDEEPIDEEEIEPVGVGEIVHKSQPLISEIVKPEMSTRTGSTMASFRKRKRKLFRDLSEDSGEGTSVTSDVDGLTIEEVKELTELNSINDFGEEGVLRNKIQRIQKLDNIDEKSKNKLVTKLMMGNYYKYVNEKLSQENKQLLRPLRKQTLVINGGDGLDNLAEEDEEEQEEAQEDKDMEDEGEDEDEDEDNVVLTAEDTVPSYNDPPFNTTLGCPHYHRNCKVECPTCLKWYPCRFCHDNEITDHKLIRNEVKHILCMHCQTPQVPDTNYCINCEQELANYFCRKCVLYDNDPNKDIYHCDKCGICRLGLGIGKDYFHCDTCNVCLSIDLHDKHKCVTNTTHCNCTICNEYLFTSVQKVVFMKCGHSIHQHCYDELITHSYKCPICKKTIVNVETQFRLLDQEVMQSPLPPPYNAWRCIISCNDCKGKSNCSYHVLGLKCKYCKSYNTNQLKLIKPEEEEEEEEEGIIDGDVMHDFDAKVMRDVRINLSKNFRIDTQVVEDENSGYEDDEEDEEFEDEDTRQEDEYDEVIPENLVDLKKLTNAILSDDYHRINSNVSYITNMFQNFINNATKK